MAAAAEQLAQEARETLSKARFPSNEAARQSRKEEEHADISRAFGTNSKMAHTRVPFGFHENSRIVLLGKNSCLCFGVLIRRMIAGIFTALHSSPVRLHASMMMTVPQRLKSLEFMFT